MKKKVFVVFISILIFVSMIYFVIAQSNNSNQSNPPPSSPQSPQQSGIDRVYQCLENQINNKNENSISLQEAVFGVLALGAKQKLTSVVESKKISNTYWKESSSGIKDTSQVLLAYDRINKNTDTIENWILTNEKTAADLTWYLQIDVPNLEEASCTISYANEQRTITINPDQTLSGNAGSCLTLSSSQYWLRVNNNNVCIEHTYTISCNEDFVTSLLYQRGTSGTIFVSPTTHSAAALGSTQEKINSKCFSETNACDYEGTLWAALALDQAGKDVSKYLPYLLALSEANTRYLPSSFLHKITSGADQYSQLIQLQQQNKYWQAPNTPYNRFYDSALAMLSLQGTSSTELSNSIAYFEGITTPEGCWNNNNIRDTAFLLYAGWPRAVSTSTGGSTPPATQTCTSQGYTCTSLFTCNDLGGTSLDFSCSTGVCCSQAPELQSCSAQSGVLCSSSETCSGTTVQSSDGSCCLGTCNPLPSANECETEGGSCYDSCNDNEEQASYSCDSDSEVCCIPKSETEGGSSFTLWIIILAILIVLVVLGIIFKQKIQLMLFKNKFKQGSLGALRGIPPDGRPPFPPSGPIPLRGRPQFIRPQATTVQRRTSSVQDKEMEETMRKLKEMSK